MQIKEIRRQLFNKLASTGWDEKLRFFINSNEFDSILTYLHNEVQEGRRFTPPLSDLFTPFQLCHLNILKVVFIVQEPWLNPIINDGLALSIKEGERTGIWPWYQFNKQLKQYVPTTQIIGSLELWANQGVLLLNETFTCQVMKSEKHKKIWEPFVNHVFEIISQENLLFVFFGRSEFINMVENKIIIEKLPEERGVVWNSENIWEKVNDFLDKKNITKIIW